MNEEGLYIPNYNSSKVYNFTYGFILGMQASSQFPGACAQQYDVFLKDISLTVSEAMTGYLPWNWFNFLDRLRTDLVDYSALQQQCQFYNILGQIKGMMSLDGLMALFSRLIP